MFRGMDGCKRWMKIPKVRRIIPKVIWNGWPNNKTLYLKVFDHL